MEASAVGIDNERLVSLLIPGGRLVPKRAFSSIATGGRSAMLDLLRSANKFDYASFESALEEAEATRSLDSVVTWMNAREHDMMQRMSYLHPVSPPHHLLRRDEGSSFRPATHVRGRLAGLSAAGLRRIYSR